VKRGLSLLELLIALAVLGLLLGLGVPNFLRWRAQAEVDEVRPLPGPGLPVRPGRGQAHERPKMRAGLEGWL
jgi:prepilin-type N-terminal cleavage/methylation domain-containing protein